MGTAVIRLTSGEAKRIKQIMSNSNTLKVLVEFNFMKLIVQPTTPKNANSWSGLPKSNNVYNNQKKKGSPINCPTRIIKR